MTNDEIKTFIENAIKENRVMLFMKGTPQQPACGFSLRASGALNALGVKYAALDIVMEMFESGELAELLGVEQPELEAEPEAEQPVQQRPIGLENRLN